MKKYAIILPRNKEAYIKGFCGREKLAFLISDKVGNRVRRTEAIPEFFGNAFVFSSELASDGLNERATLIANVGIDEDIFGNALLLAEVDGEPAGFDLSGAEWMKSIIDGIRG